MDIDILLHSIGLGGLHQAQVNLDRRVLKEDDHVHCEKNLAILHYRSVRVHHLHVQYHQVHQGVRWYECKNKAGVDLHRYLSGFCPHRHFLLQK